MFTSPSCPRNGGKAAYPRVPETPLSRCSECLQECALTSLCISDPHRVPPRESRRTGGTFFLVETTIFALARSRPVFLSASHPPSPPHFPPRGEASIGLGLRHAPPFPTFPTRSASRFMCVRARHAFRAPSEARALFSCMFGGCEGRRHARPNRELEVISHGMPHPSTFHRHGECGVDGGWYATRRRQVPDAASRNR